MQDYLQAMIADMRAHGGQITQGPLAGRPTLILTSTGAKTGLSRTAVLNYSRDGDAYVVAASKGGAPTNPGWYHNLRAHPSVTVEVNGETFDATARATEEDERTRLWSNHIEVLPNFAEYPSKTSRVIPVLVLERAA